MSLSFWSQSLYGNAVTYLSPGLIEAKQRVYPGILSCYKLIAESDLKVFATPSA
ncbi:MAG: hypothetical protein P1U89_24615 [Verrucomicrobiales bacterium]|nr:hypothetical protein [Verrucomicrobiales bacterium]